ncbi:unnamed protein product [Prorocentrum cordatum]|uniref:Uncharacterized protein n=1 Tax=Prorocentrum cordatum TaxID=2364126 RepID=A0ABN9XA22_9DINO|nr:unnamed protein product [Polarella glacialis]
MRASLMIILEVTFSVFLWRLGSMFKMVTLFFMMAFVPMSFVPIFLMTFLLVTFVPTFFPMRTLMLMSFCFQVTAGQTIFQMQRMLAMFRRVPFYFPLPVDVRANLLDDVPTEGVPPAGVLHDDVRADRPHDLPL